MGAFFASPLFYLLLAGVAAIGGAALIKRGRLQEEESSLVEKALWAAGLIMVATSLLIGMFRADVLENPDAANTPPNRGLKDYGQGSGCSEPKDKLKEFKPSKGR